MPSDLASRFESAYYRYGPGRLPGADRRDVGGGYAFASVMAVFSAVFLLNQTVGVGWGDPWPPVDETLGHYAIVVSLLVGSGFVAGFLVWRYLPEDLPDFDLTGGLAASVLTHLTVVLVVDVIVVVGVEYTTWAEKLTGIVVAYSGAVYVVTRDLIDVAVVLYLVGITGGYVYEQIRRRRNP